jgi:hypothetical protein
LETAAAIPLPELPLLLASLKDAGSLTSLRVAAAYAGVAASRPSPAADSGWGDVPALSSAWRATSTNNALHR